MKKLQNNQRYSYANSYNVNSSFSRNKSMIYIKHRLEAYVKIRRITSIYISKYMLSKLISI